MAGTIPSSTHASASATWGTCIVQPTSRRPFAAACVGDQRAGARQEAHAEELDERSQGQRAGQDGDDRAHRADISPTGCPGWPRRRCVHLLTKPLNSGTPGDGEGRHDRRDRRQRHVFHQPAHFVQVLRAGGVEHRTGVEEQQRLEQAVVEDVKQRAEQAIAASAASARSRRRQQRHARPDAQQDVADLADAVEGQQTLGLLLLEGLHGAGEKCDRAQHGDDQTPARQRIVGLRRRAAPARGNSASGHRPRS